MSGVTDMISDEETGRIRRTCTELKETEGCSTIPLLPGIGLGENTNCYCSTDLCNEKLVSSGSAMSSSFSIRTYVAVASCVLSHTLT